MREYEIEEEDDKVIRLSFPASNGFSGASLDILYQDDDVQLCRFSLWIGPFFWQPHFLLPA